MVSGAATPVRRTRLLQILRGAAPGDIVRIRAPAGYGKTRLLAQYGETLRAEGRLSVAVLDLRACNAQPVSPTAALREAGEIAALCEGAPESPVALLVDGLEDLACGDAGAPLEGLVQGAASLLLVTAGVGESGVPPGRISGRCLTLGPLDLAFELEETVAFLEGVVPAEQIVVLHERTEGWPRGLQLARDWYASRGALALPTSELGDCLGQIAEAFRAETVQGLGEDIEAALQDAAVLDEFDAECLGAFLGRSDAHDLLEAARRSGGLVRPAECGRGAWRLHRLARASLHEALCRRRGPAAIAGLNIRAAGLRRARGQFSAALTHAARARDSALALDIFEQAGGLRAVAHIGYVGLRTLCSTLPEGLLERSPRLGLARAISLLAAGLPPAGRHAFERVRAAVNSVAASAGPCDLDLGLAHQVFDLYAAAYGDRAVGDDFLARLELRVNDPARQSLEFRLLALKFLVMRYQQCGELVRASHRIAEFYRTQALAKVQASESNIPVYEGLIAFARGELDAAEAHFRSVPSHLTSEGQVSAIYVAARVFLAEVMYGRDQVDDAERTLRAAMPHLERVEGWFDTYAAAYGLAARLAARRGDAGLARAHCEALRDLAARRGSDRLRVFADAYEAELLCRLEKPAGLADLVGDRRRLTARLLASCEPHADASWREDDVLSSVAVQWAIATGDHEATDLLIQAHCARAHRQQRTPSLVKGLLMRALVDQRRGRNGQALEALRTAIAPSARAGLRGVWLDEGEPLQRLVRRGLAAGFADLLTPQEASFLRGLNAAAPGDTGRLTQREYDVLGELSLGQSNKQIGRRLGMSENTVKTHMKSLFGKLQVERRREAIDVARARGLA